MKKDLILFMGQSNMQGETEGCSETREVSGALEYKYLTDTLTPLKNPVGENIGHSMKPFLKLDGMEFLDQLNDTVLLAPEKDCTTLLPAFARSYIKMTNHEIVAVHAARGSTGIDYWLPGTEGYISVVTKTLGAIRKIGKENIRKIYVVWLQGESDMVHGMTKKDYMERLISLRDGLSAELGIDTFGIIRVGTFSSVVNWLNGDIETRKANDKTIQDAQDTICKEQPGFLMLTTITDKLIFGDSKYKNPNAEAHYSSLGQEIIGSLAGKHFGAYAIGGEFDPDEAGF